MDNIDDMVEQLLYGGEDVLDDIADKAVRSDMKSGNVDLHQMVIQTVNATKQAPWLWKEQPGQYADPNMQVQPGVPGQPPVPGPVGPASNVGVPGIPPQAQNPAVAQASPPPVAPPGPGPNTAAMALAGYRPPVPPKENYLYAGNPSGQGRAQLAGTPINDLYARGGTAPPTSLAAALRRR